MLISWEVRVFGDPEIICSVPPSSFFPMPKVVSCIFRIRVRKEVLIPQSQIPQFFKLLEQSYKQPRKTIQNNLMAFGRFTKEELSELLHQANIMPTLRPHQLKFSDWQSLFAAMGLSSRETLDQ
jgi:16S rRNA (adenine1518-N6/adenine1519-N6)-dimethyltransferase